MNCLDLAGKTWFVGLVVICACGCAQDGEGPIEDGADSGVPDNDAGPDADEHDDALPTPNDANAPMCEGVSFPGGCMLTERLSAGSAVGFNGTFSLLRDGTALVVGGSDDGHSSIAGVRRYRSSAYGWEAAADMPQARSSHVAISIGEQRLLVTGGRGCVTSFGHSECDYDLPPLIYDGATDTWEEAPMTAILSESDTVGTSVRIHEAAFARSQLGTTLWAIYNDETKSWWNGTYAAALTGAQVVALPGGRVVLYSSGGAFSEAFAPILIIDPDKKMFAVGPMLPDLQEGMAVALDEETVLFVSGVRNQPSILAWELDVPTMTLSEVSAPDKRGWTEWLGFVGQSNGYVVGLIDTVERDRSIGLYDRYGDAWHYLPGKDYEHAPVLTADQKILTFDYATGELWSLEVTRADSN